MKKICIIVYIAFLPIPFFAQQAKNTNKEMAAQEINEALRTATKALGTATLPLNNLSTNELNEGVKQLNNVLTQIDWSTMAGLLSQMTTFAEKNTDALTKLIDGIDIAPLAKNLEHAAKQIEKNMDVNKMEQQLNQIDKKLQRSLNQQSQKIDRNLNVETK